MSPKKVAKSYSEKRVTWQGTSQRKEKIMGQGLSSREDQKREQAGSGWGKDAERKPDGKGASRPRDGRGG